jgi:hypothetical protein
MGVGNILGMGQRGGDEEQSMVARVDATKEPVGGALTAIFLH